MSIIHNCENNKIYICSTRLCFNFIYALILLDKVINMQEKHKKLN